ncbi:MAG: hypothetical protein C0597_12575 [Marinilabiliales bacterium]|nr:MAG: hypothetical protein C0597_12575 [Marinilabiliales bacterium]
MDSIFLFKVTSSFLIAGTWIALSTMLAERLGSKIGGLISNLPSNILVSLIFIALVNDVNYVASTVVSVPLGITICTMFMVVFIVLLRFSLFKAISISLIFWFILAFLSSTLSLNNFFINILIAFITIFISVIFLEKVLKTPSIKNSKRKLSFPQFVSRIIFSGSIVASVVIISKFSTPYFVGIFATFPSMLLSTMIILSINQGKKFAQATGKILVLSLSNTVVYIIAVYFTYPKFGILFGTLISYTLSALWITFLYPLVRKLI